MRLGAVVVNVVLAGCVVQMVAQTAAVHGDNGVALGAPPTVAVVGVTDKVGQHTYGRPAYV